jgi:hypothetical protein
MIPTIFVHAVNTTGMHNTERGQFSYASTCDQCGVEITDKDLEAGRSKGTGKAAAHVVAYPICCLGLIDCLTLKTTCQKCNNYNNTKVNPCFVGCWGCGPFLGGPYCCPPCCCQKDFRQGNAAY